VAAGVILNLTAAGRLRVTDNFKEETVAREARPARQPADNEVGSIPKRLFALVRQNVTPRLGAALVLWRIEAYTATPLALLLVATLGRWSGALAMGALMALYAAAFLFLLKGDPLFRDVRAWADGRPLGRLLEGVAEQRGWRGAARRVLAVPLVIMFLGPFWRAVTFHLFRARPLPAYVFSVGGSIPHSLLWTGLVLGGIWEGLVWPFLKAHVL